MAVSETEETVKLYFDMVFRLAYARMLDLHDAEDVCQEVFLRYVRKKPVFSSDEHRRAWLVRVTLNCAAKCAKRRARNISAGAAEEAVPFEGERYAELHEALASLPPSDRYIIHLFYFEDMPTADIARTLRMRQSTVLSRLSRARRKLRSFLEEEE